MNDPEVIRHGESYYITTPAVIFGFDHVRDHSDGLAAEVTATLTATGKQHWAKLNLASTIGRRDYTKALVMLDTGLECNGLIDTVCRVVVKQHRMGPPAQPLIAAPPSPESWLLSGLIPKGQTSILFGDGGSAKSLLALALAIAGLTGAPLGRSYKWTVAPLTSVLYLDWESDYADHSGRLWGLSRFHGEGAEVTGITYRRMTRALTDDLPAIAHTIAENKTDLVVVDSLGAAGGAEPESADTAIRTLSALATLPCTRLVQAHVPKAIADQRTGTPRPYGSVYVQNLARSVIHCEAAEQAVERELIVTYTHTKCNLGPKQAPRALSFSFGEEGYINVNVNEPDLGHAGLPTQILTLLREGKQTVSSIAADLGANPGSVKMTLNRLKDRHKVIRLDENQGGRGKETLWGLIDTKRINP